jgi:hypothetical protein
MDLFTQKHWRYFHHGCSYCCYCYNCFVQPNCSSSHSVYFFHQWAPYRSLISAHCLLLDLLFAILAVPTFFRGHSWHCHTDNYLEKVSHPYFQKRDFHLYCKAYFRSPWDYALGNSGIFFSQKSSFCAEKLIVIAFIGMNLKLILDYYSLCFSFTSSVMELLLHQSHYLHY